MSTKKKTSNRGKKNLFYCFFFSIYNFFKHILYALIWPLFFVVYLFSNGNSNPNLKIDKLKEKSKRLKEKEDRKLNKIKEKEEKKLNKAKIKKQLEDYKNEDIVLEKKNLGYYINAALLGIIAVPKGIKKKFDNIALVRNARNKKAFDTKTMLVDFSDTTEEEKQGKRIVWKYVAINKDNKKVTGYFEAYTRLDVQSFLIGEGLVVYSVTTSPFIQSFHANVGGVKFKNKDLIFLLAQLSTYLKSGIPLVECLNILIKQVQKKAYKTVLRDVTYDLTVGESFSQALEKRGNSFPKLLINMVKTSELTGELPEALDDMVDYYTETEEARKEMISALTYPTIVFVFTLAVVTFVMIYVVPKFVDIYDSMEASEIPKFTKTVINVSNYLKSNGLYLLIIASVGMLILYYLYKNVKVIRTLFQWIFMHIPVLKEVIIYNEVTMFSKTFASLLYHNVYITDSMDILNRVTNNEIYKMMIIDTIANLARGDKISKAFENQWAFPVPAYEMIVTGEKTGQLAEMMSRVSTYYQGLHKTVVSRVKALIEPILIVFLTFSVGTILLAVIIPMFNMYQQVQGLGSGG